MLDILIAVILGIVEGITEWLPISSTGHMILVEQFLHMSTSHEFNSMFRVVIQLGAIMAVVVLYFNKLNPFSKRKSAKQKRNTINLWCKIIVACLPAAVIGLLFDDILDKYLYQIRIPLYRDRSGHSACGMSGSVLRIRICDQIFDGIYQEA